MSRQEEPLRGSPIEPLQRTLSETALEALARRVVDEITVVSHKDQAFRTGPRPDSVEIARLAQALLAGNDGPASSHLCRLQAEGLPLEVLYARYLAPAAAQLGELWDHDKITFLQVTLGITRLFGLMRILRMNLPTPRITRREPIVFAAVPGEQHTMGIEMAVELFRQRGWDVEMMLGAEEAEVLRELDVSGSKILGLSSAGRKTAEAMAHLIFMVRATRPDVHVMVSGQIVSKEPDLVALMNADSTLACVEDALAAMDRLCSGQTAAS